ncbi:MAG: hypothetical protein SNJ77_05045 [Cytophagales bacterium]
MKNGSFVLCCVVFLACSSCKKSVNFEGPALSEILGPFELISPLDVSQDTADLQNQPIHFKAQFSRKAQWSLEITSTKSTSSFVLSGFSKELNTSNAQWRGGAQTLPSFQKGDAKAVLRVNGIESTWEIPFFISSPKKMDEGFLITGFESNPGFEIDYSVDGDTIQFLSSPLTAPFGNTYLWMNGRDKNRDTYIGNLSIPARAVSNNQFSVFQTNMSNPAQTYFNLLIYGYGINSTRISLQFSEDDNLDGTFNGNNEDLYERVIDVNWTGWRLISFKYDEIVNLSYSGAPGTNGNKVKEPHKIFRIGIVHLSNPAGNRSSLAIDHLIFTSNRPFEP